MEQLKTKIVCKLGDAEVRGGSRTADKMDIHIKGMDALVVLDNVRMTLKDIIPGTEVNTVELGNFRPMYGNNLAITARMSSVAGEALLRAGRVKIGLNLCRVERSPYCLLYKAAGLRGGAGDCPKFKRALEIARGAKSKGRKVSEVVAEVAEMGEASSRGGTGSGPDAWSHDGVADFEAVDGTERRQ